MRKRKQRRLKKLIVEERLAYGVEVPPDSVVADRSQLGSSFVGTRLPVFYVDVDFTCTDCGSDEVWTAERQKWYYEVAKGWFPITPERCRDCREKIDAQKQLQREQMAKAQHCRQVGNGP